jgi:hypothetical protein
MIVKLRRPRSGSAQWHLHDKGNKMHRWVSVDDLPLRVIREAGEEPVTYWFATIVADGVSVTLHERVPLQDW